MAKKKKSYRRAPKISIASVAGLVPLAIKVKDGFKYEGASGAGEQLVRGLTGYSPKNGNWSWDYLKGTLIPALAGPLVHKLANKFGVNRALRAVPFVNI